MINVTNPKHWQMVVEDDDIVWLYANSQKGSTNTLHREAVHELDLILRALAQDVPKGLVIGSHKPNAFIMGADIEEFETLHDPEVIAEYIRYGQNVLHRLAEFPAPTVAMISGFCLGGGMELALACRYRIAENNPKTRLGLPEVKLGILPAWGGTVRLPQLISPITAFELILSGQLISADRAKKLGMIDESLPLRELARAAKYYIVHQPKVRRVGWMGRLCQTAIVRRILAYFMQRKVSQHLCVEQYPAPFAIIENWRKYGVHAQTAYPAEVDTLKRLFSHPTTRNLVRIFFLQDELKEAAKQVKDDIQHVHVIGAGVMGGDIAGWCVLKGLTVTLQDQNAARLSGAMGRCYKLLKTHLKSDKAARYAFDKLAPDVAGEGIKKADLIIEAVFEDVQVKRDVLQHIEAHAKPSALIATNTSSISLNELKTALKQPKRFLGIHFFNPVDKMQLVEVVYVDETSPVTQKAGLAFVKNISKLPLLVKNSPGFLVNRVLAPYLLEAVLLFEEGVEADKIDKAAKQFGMPMGPIALIDTVGIDICVAAMQHLHYDIPQLVNDKIQHKMLGKKTGQGFYRYQQGRRVREGSVRMPGKKNETLALQEIASRLILRMINESVACYGEGIVASGNDIDAGLIFGAGFAPFRGGPIHYILTAGYDNVYPELLAYYARYGERFAPSTGWEALHAFFLKENSIQEV